MIKVYPKCFRCGGVPYSGLYDGFRLKNRFFCTRCKDEILDVEIGCRKYEEVKDLIKEIMKLGF